MVCLSSAPCGEALHFVSFCSERPITRAVAQALVMQVVGGQLSARAAVGCQQSLGVCPCMGCRQNLKKEKRLRNRLNAFRFKKNGATTLGSCWRVPARAGVPA